MFIRRINCVNDYRFEVIGGVYPLDSHTMIYQTDDDDDDDADDDHDDDNDDDDDDADEDDDDSDDDNFSLRNPKYSSRCIIFFIFSPKRCQIYLY